MIITDKDAKARLGSPLNLMNQLAAARANPRKSAMSLFGIGKPKEETKVETPVNFNPFTKTQAIIPAPPIPPPAIPDKPTELQNILENHESQIKLGLAHDKALELLNTSVALLSTKLDDISPNKLPTVISAASKVVESIRKERNEAAKNNKDREVHYHFYTPQQRKLAEYDVIDVGVEA